jgi:cytochrome c biogenesis protein CcmG/thiol:disulfide interchange protein DsbE
MQADEYDPHALPSPLIGHKLPAFSLPGMAGLPGFANTDLSAPAKPLLVNWFASWCGPCQDEAPQLAALAASGLPIWGIAYEDDEASIKSFLATHGTPYQRLGSDASGLTAINWGVYGVPETYLIDKTGIVRWRYAGALTPDLVTSTLQPLLAHYS